MDIIYRNTFYLNDVWEAKLLALSIWSSPIQFDQIDKASR
jgi:hypothetical protein